MTSLFGEGGVNIPCTIVEAGPCYVTQIKSDESDGYNAVQLAYGDKKEKNTSKPMKGHFAKSGVSPKSKLIEVKNFDLEVAEGDEVTLDAAFEEGDTVNVVGVSKGKGFQGVVKRHNFKGVGDATHGQHNRQRAPGSIGAASYPARVFKGMRMAGQTGSKRVKVKNLQVVKILKEENLLLIKGAIPGSKGSVVIIEK
ncbi:UNVERIFIED_CONTAM: hypothetical protein GTU68_033454 [Idotea baltica]|nr:hypothetical protein [Idotea baltica]